ncbi:translation initiation factor IF-2-like [Falco biarmicus]|uniref:translation initiation factor IF-2-like n=1 Tax=Falco biarmicus TaxID=345155 RepID=UPI0024BC4B8A|nr:translation initiation factor IF-2-like [Falco biarmicus]
MRPSSRRRAMLSITGRRWARSRTKICSPTAPRGSETPRALPGRGNGAGGTTRKSILPAPAPHPTALGKRRKGGSAPGKRGSAPGKRRKEDSAPGKRRKGNPAPGKQQRGDSAPGKRQKGDSAPRKRWKGNPTPGKQQQGDSAPKDLRHHGRARPRVAGRKPHRGAKHPAARGGHRSQLWPRFLKAKRTREAADQGENDFPAARPCQEGETLRQQPPATRRDWGGGEEEMQLSPFPTDSCAIHTPLP